MAETTDFVLESDDAAPTPEADSGATAKDASGEPKQEQPADSAGQAPAGARDDKDDQGKSGE